MCVCVCMCVSPHFVAGFKDGFLRKKERFFYIIRLTLTQLKYH